MGPSGVSHSSLSQASAEQVQVGGLQLGTAGMGHCGRYPAVLTGLPTLSLLPSSRVSPPDVADSATPCSAFHDTSTPVGRLPHDSGAQLSSSWAEGPPTGEAKVPTQKHKSLGALSYLSTNTSCSVCNKMSGLPLPGRKSHVLSSGDPAALVYFTAELNAT